LIRSGAAADRPGLVRALRAAGHAETRAPGFDEDIAALRKYSREECERLARHTRLPIGDGIPLTRDCLPSLSAAIGGGSLLVVGEPGAGKTGALVALATQLAGRTAPFVFFSVERLVGLTGISDFRRELGLTNDLLDVLAAWPGVESARLLHRQRLVDTLPLTMPIAEALAILAASISQIFRGVVVVTRETGGKRKSYPTRSAWPSLIAMSSNRLFAITDYEARAAEEPLNEDGFGAFLDELTAHGEGFEARLLALLGRKDLRSPWRFGSQGDDENQL
jgi:hypothetical protein